MGIVELMRSTAGIIVAVIGLIPIAAGVFNFCLLGPVFGVDLHGKLRASH